MGMWRRLRLRTKVLIVVGALVVFGALSPDDDQDAIASSDRQKTVQADEKQPETHSSDEPASDETATEDVVTTEEPEVEDISVPALRSQSLQEARNALRQAGLTSEVVRQPSWRPVGTVLKQGTAAGVALAAGSLVTLVVAAPMPRVPGVLGQGVDAGRSAITRAGFKVSIVRKDVTSGSNNVVLSQTPAASTQASPGSVVELVVSNLVQPVVPLVSNCTTGYKPCLPPAPDYDCAGGSGDGPKYASGPIYVTGSDPYDLDSEGDGIACEA